MTFAPKNPESAEEAITHFFRELDRIGVRDFFATMVRDNYLATLEEVVGPSREQHVIQARAAVISYFSARGWSVNAIAKLFGRDRATIEHHLRSRARA